MTTFVIADIHGVILSLNDVLKRCKFKKSDTLICLGDSVDGGNATKSVIDKLLTIPKLINIIGNHDIWALQWMKTGAELPIWWHQGGMRTAESYNFDYESVPQSHIDFLERALPYYIDTKNRIFVHGGFIPNKPIESQGLDILTWDRDLLCNYAPKNIVKEYTHVFVGHTSTQFFDILKEPSPKTFNNVTGMDCGVGWSGVLSIMDVDTFKFWISPLNANIQNKLSLINSGKF